MIAYCRRARLRRSKRTRAWAVRRVGVAAARHTLSVSLRAGRRSHGRMSLNASELRTTDCNWAFYVNSVHGFIGCRGARAPDTRRRAHASRAQTVAQSERGDTVTGSNE